MSEYYILEKGEKLGPFTPEELMDRPLEPSDVLLLPMQNQGTPAYDMPEFDAYFKSEGIYYPTKQNTSSYMLRLPAFIIDYFIIFFGAFLLAAITIPGYIARFEQEIMPVPFNYDKYIANIAKYQNVELVLQFVVLAILILYHAACESGRLRGSVGKYVMGLVVVDELGYSLTFWQALKRNLGKIIYEVAGLVVGPLSYLFYLRMIWGDRHQAVHDQLSRCYVVKK
jgi:uncharacterized RDD family membrane protein YckC